MSARTESAGTMGQGGRLPAICHVIPTLETGGMERVVLSLLDGFGGRGHRMFLFCTDWEGELFETARADAKMCGRRRRLPLKVDWRVVGVLRRFVRENNIQILHAHNLMAQMYSVLAAIGSPVKVVVTVHGLAYFGTKLIHRLQKPLSWGTAKVVCVSEDMVRSATERRCVDPRKMIVIRNGIPMSELQSRPAEQTAAARARPGIPVDSLVVGSVGRFAEVKNYPLLVRAFARLLKQRESTMGTKAYGPGSPLLLLVGDGPERPNIERAIAECGIADSVLLPGMQGDVTPWMSAMDIFCLSSITEGTSLSLLEAGAAGLPAVATAVGGNCEVIENGVTGLLVPCGNEVALAGALGRLADDVELRRRMGAAAAVRTRAGYSLVNMFEKYSELYHGLGKPA
ncbi:MAG: glycosyltransferase [bacterium]